MGLTIAKSGTNISLEWDNFWPSMGLTFGNQWDLSVMPITQQFDMMLGGPSIVFHDI